MYLDAYIYMQTFLKKKKRFNVNNIDSDFFSPNCCVTSVGGRIDLTRTVSVSREKTSHNCD